MSSEWLELPLGDVVSFKTGKLDSNASEENGQFPFFTCSPTTLSINSFAFDTEAVILAGNNANGVFSTKHYSGKFNAYQRTYVIEPIDKESISCRYVYFVISHMVGHLKELSIGSATKFLTKTILNDLRVRIPPKMEQDGIALLLSSLDDRISFLRETNTTLEAIAQALFKSWFVDFDPVRANMARRSREGGNPALGGGSDALDSRLRGNDGTGMDAATAALFPDSFEASELGEVPKGWRVAQCQDLFEVRDGTHESPKPSLEGYPLVTSKHITSGRVNFQDTYLISEGDYAAISKRSKVNRLDVLITMIGTVGLSAILLDERNDFAIKNIGLFKTSAAPNFAYFLSILLKSTKMQEYLYARLAGTTQKYLSLKALREIGLLVPSESVLVEFSKIASTLFEGIHRNNQQAQTLATLRDTLLPRLISGQLRLPV